MPRSRQLKRWERVLENIARSRAGAWFAIHVANPVDRRLLRWTNGRIGLYLGQPVGVLEHVGAKSGSPRETPLLYLADGERIVLVASKGGAPRHPSWYHNVRANPEVNFRHAGRSERYRAREAVGAERDQLWDRVNDLYAGYDDYQERAGCRRIPVIVLEPQP